MKLNILYILAGAKIYGGTPKKTLDLIKYSNYNSYIYFYSMRYSEFVHLFRDAGASTYQGYFGNNLIKHVKELITIIDQNEINIVQTQFEMGTVLGYLIKILRPNTKLIVSFVNPFKPNFVRSLVMYFAYRKANHIIFVSKYVQDNKYRQFPILKSKSSSIIYNGTDNRIDNGNECFKMKKYSLLAVSSLLKWKNIQILVDAMNIIINNYNKKHYYLYIAGEGKYRSMLELLVEKYCLNDHVFLLGNQNSIGKLLETADVYLHPAYAEGFGIAVAEAMMAGKPIIAANAGALPELIKDGHSGFLVNPHNAEDWAEKIIYFINNKELSNKIVKNAIDIAEREFSIINFIDNYNKLYETLLSD